MTLTSVQFSQPTDYVPPIVEEDNGCLMLSAEAAGLPEDVWSAIPRPSANFVAVMQKPPPERSPGGILLPEQTQEDRETLDYVGRVVAMGPYCYRHRDFMVVDRQGDDHRQILPPPRCQPGDWVIFKRHEQFKVPVRNRNAVKSEPAVIIRFTMDYCILAAAPHPDQLKVYIV